MSAADGMMLWTGDYLADTQHLHDAARRVSADPYGDVAEWRLATGR